MHWGHTVASREGPQPVTRLEYNTQAGVESPAEPIVPFCAEHVWSYWWELNRRRPPGFESISPFSYTEICHWMVLTGRELPPYEVRWLVDMDDAYLDEISKERSAKREREQEKQDSRKPRPRK